jgi:hypothetical protein
VSEVDMSFKGFIESILGSEANALELLKKHNTTQDITEKVEGILFMRLELSLSFPCSNFNKNCFHLLFPFELPVAVAVAASANVGNAIVV